MSAQSHQQAHQQAYQHDFRRSRIWAEGWNAARKASLGQPAQNPYPPGADHIRWSEGFAQANV